MLKGYASYAQDMTSKSHLVNSSKASEDPGLLASALKKSTKKLPPTSKPSVQQQSQQPGRRDQAGSLGKSRDKLENSYNSSRGNRSGATHTAHHVQFTSEMKGRQERKPPKAKTTASEVHLSRSNKPRV